KFLGMRQVTGQSTQVFLNMLYGQAERCEWSNLRDRMILLILLVGMQDCALSQQLQSMGSSLNLKTAIDRIKAKEVVMEHQQIVRPATLPSSPNVPTVLPKEEPTTTSVDNAQFSS